MKIPFFLEPLSVLPMVEEPLEEESDDDDEEEEEEAADDVEDPKEDEDASDPAALRATAVAATSTADAEVEANCCLA